jgi:HAD superfamily hydrolase (TIGR01509 family)
MGSTRPLAIIFDCDGVLVDSEMLASRVEAEVARDLGLTLTAEEAHDLFLGKTVDGVFELIGARAGQPLKASFVYNWAFATARTFVRELQAVAGVRAVIQELRARGHALAVASQSPLARVHLSLEATGLAELFGQHVYVTSMVKRPKPAPDIYLLAASKLGAAPADCLVIEDSPAGAAAALGCGMHVIGYEPGGGSEAMRTSGAIVIRAMDELLPKISALISR